MPRGNPESSFESAVTHLLRHVNDEFALRNNPLVRKHLVSMRSQRANVLPQIQSLVLVETESICRQLAAVGQLLHAERRQAIVLGLCSGEPPAETARRLGVSISHYYRERQAIGRSLGRALMSSPLPYASGVAASEDPLELLVNRANELATRGCAVRAARMLEDTHSCLPDGIRKSAIGLELAEEFISLGKDARALALLTSFQSKEYLSSEHVGSEWLRNRIPLTEARLIVQLFPASSARSALEALARRRIAERRADDVTFAILHNYGEVSARSGNYRVARSMLQQMRRIDDKLPQLDAKRQVMCALLSAHCAEDSVDELAIAEGSCIEALHLGIARGEVTVALDALGKLASHAATVGRDDEVYALANYAVRLASDVDGGRTVGHFLVPIISATVRTRHWGAANPLLFRLEALLQPNSFSLASLKQAQGAVLTRMGKLREARDSLEQSYEQARSLGNRRIEALALRDQALLMSLANQRGLSRDLIAESVQLAEEHCSIGERCETYNAAARLLADRRSMRLAAQAKAAISACAQALREASSREIPAACFSPYVGKSLVLEHEALLPNKIIGEPPSPALNER
jgi:tetratricopeptide (TPR) repeat protein